MKVESLAFPVPAFPVKNTFCPALTSSKTSCCISIARLIFLARGKGVMAGITHHDQS